VSPSVFGSRLYVPSSKSVLDAASGSQLGAYPGWSEVSPVFARGLGLFLDLGTFRGVNLANGKTRWKRRVGRDEPSAASRRFTISPVAVGHSAYGVTADGQLYALALRNGVKIWRAHVPFLDGPGHSGSYNGAIDVAPGLLLVPGGRKLTAFESVYRPGPAGIAASPILTDVEFRQRNFVQGVVGSDLRKKGARVTLEYDEPPFRGFSRAARGRIGPDGFFSFVLRPALNIRVRARAGKARSRARTIYTYPRTRYKIRRLSPTRIRAGIFLRTDPSIRLGGRRLSLYVVRVRARRSELLGSATLSGRGRGRSSASIAFRALRHVGRRDYLATCVRGQLRLGLGRPSGFTRHCGRRRIRF
jgi:hypothetical protein